MVGCEQSEAHKNHGEGSYRKHLKNLHIEYTASIHDTQNGIKVNYQMFGSLRPFGVGY